MNQTTVATAKGRDWPRGRTKGRPLSILLAIVVVPVAVLLLLLASPFILIFSGPKSRSSEQVARILERASEGTLSERHWRSFTQKPIRDKRLDAIRQRAAVCGPPSADRLMLRQLVKEARAGQIS